MASLLGELIGALAGIGFALLRPKLCKLRRGLVKPGGSATQGNTRGLEVLPTLRELIRHSEGVQLLVSSVQLFCQLLHVLYDMGAFHAVSYCCHAPPLPERFLPEVGSITFG
jgi:hypothetical protein